MNTFQTIFSFLSRTLKNKYKAIIAVLGISFGISVLMEVPFWFMLGFVPSSSVVRNIFDNAVQNLNNGIPLLQSIPQEQFGTLILILCFDLVLSTLMLAFINGGLISMLAEEGNHFNSNLAVFFRQGWRKLPRLVGVYLFTMAIVIASVLIGVVLGIVVYPIAALVVVISAIIAIYFMVKFAFLEYEAALTCKTFTEIVNFSYKITSGLGWPLCFIIIGSGFVSSAIYNLSGNLIILSNLISSVFAMLTILLILPLYLEARHND